MSLAWSRRSSNSGRREIASRRLAGKPARMLSSAFCRYVSCSASCAFALKDWLVGIMACNSRRWRHPPPHPPPPPGGGRGGGPQIFSLPPPGGGGGGGGGASAVCV